MWAPARESEVSDESDNSLKDSRFAILAAEGGKVFNREVWSAFVLRKMSVKQARL